MTTQERPGITRLWRRAAMEPMSEERRPDSVRATEVRRPRARTQEELVTLFATPVWRFVSSQIRRREDAEDVVMEVFAAAFASFGKLERAADQRLWLLVVARNKVASALRRQYLRAESPYTAVEETSDGVSRTASDLQLTMQTALDRIPAEQRDALILKYVNGLSTEEVGCVLRKSIPATNSLLQRGRDAMRQILGPDTLEISSELP